MHTHLPTPDPNTIRTITLSDDGNDAPEIERAFYEATENPVSSLQELLIRMQENIKRG